MLPKSKPITIATWNINSVRLRVAQVARFVDEAKPDILCLQEIKCQDGQFPLREFKAMGLKHMHVVGQKGWHGVAIASRFPLEPVMAPALCRHSEARAAAVKVNGIEVHCLYVPAGAEIPDPATNVKFDHKLDVLAKMKTEYAKRKDTGPLVVTGDLNVAPGEFDVWSHKQLLNVVSHTPIETERLEAAREAGGLIDTGRLHCPAPEQIFTWWSYRSPDWTKNNRGRRLDHIWASKDLADVSSHYSIYQATRGWERPSDHVPVMLKLAL
jgi:exodeoxyribonuclease III